MFDHEDVVFTVQSSSSKTHLWNNRASYLFSRWHSFSQWNGSRQGYKWLRAEGPQGSGWGFSFCVSYPPLSPGPFQPNGCMLCSGIPFQFNNNDICTGRPLLAQCNYLLFIWSLLLEINVDKSTPLELVIITAWVLLHCHYYFTHSTLAGFMALLSAAWLECQSNSQTCTQGIRLQDRALWAGKSPASAF